MTSKGKANELVIKYMTYSDNKHGYILLSKLQAIQCAIIAVDEILEYIDSKGNGYYILPDYLKNEYDYYQEVKQHLEEML